MGHEPIATGAISWGRFIQVKIVKFPAIPKSEQDPKVKEAIRTEGAGILNWALDGLDRLRERGGFDVSRGVEIETESFRLTAEAFIDDKCEKPNQVTYTRNIKTGPSGTVTNHNQ